MPELVLCGIRLLAKQFLGTILDMEVDHYSAWQLWRHPGSAVQLQWEQRALVVARLLTSRGLLGEKAENTGGAPGSWAGPDREVRTGSQMTPRAWKINILSVMVKLSDPQQCRHWPNCSSWRCLPAVSVGQLRYDGAGDCGVGPGNFSTDTTGPLSPTQSGMIVISPRSSLDLILKYLMMLNMVQTDTIHLISRLAIIIFLNRPG